MVEIFAESLAIIITFIINLPFGYWRRGVRKLSKEWFLAVHTPVPFIVLIRYLEGVPVLHIPIFVISFFLGQQAGGWIRFNLEKDYQNLGKCMVSDLIRIVRKEI